VLASTDLAQSAVPGLGSSLESPELDEQPKKAIDATQIASSKNSFLMLFSLTSSEQGLAVPPFRDFSGKKIHCAR